MTTSAALPTLNNAALQPRLQAELIVADGLCPKIGELLPGALHELVALGHSANPLAAITEELAKRRLAGRPVDTLHIVAHGRPGAFQIGGQWVTSSTLIANAAALAQWQANTIALWSCEVGGDSDIITLTIELTGSDVYCTSSTLSANRQSIRHKQDSTRKNLPQVFQEELITSWP